MISKTIGYNGVHNIFRHTQVRNMNVDDDIEISWGFVHDIHDVAVDFSMGYDSSILIYSI